MLMTPFGRFLHTATGLAAILYAVLIIVSFFGENPERIRPFSLLGWSQEMICVALGIGCTGVYVFMTRHECRSRSMVPLWASMLLGVAAASSYMRYFTIALAVLSCASFGNAWLQSLSSGGAPRSFARRVWVVATFILFASWAAFLTAGYLLVGA